jgi:hypothetical protein
MSPSACTDNLYAYKALYIFPGASFDRSLNPGSLDCSANTEPNEPNHAGTMLDSNFIKNVMIQSEFAGVYHHVDRSGSSGQAIYPNPQGPNGNTLSWNNNEASWGKRSSCNINLASIGSDGNWNARWYGASDLELVRDGAGNRNALKDAVSIVKANPNFYNGTSFKVPEVGFDDIDRYTSTTRLGRVLSSNSAKLPPITDISATAAQALCETYDVDVGFSSDGSNFLSWSFPQPKRLLGRRELVSAGAWPDSDGSSGTTDYDEATITALENGGAGMCVNSNKSIGYLDYATHGTAMTATMPKRDHSASGNFSPMKGPAVLFTGSSSNDGNIHSGLCTSRYGIQDLIGNVAESTTDLLFCDYGSDKLFFGRFAGDGLKDYSIELPPYNTENEITVWTGATVTVYSDTSIDGATCDPAPGGGFDCMVVNGNTTKGQMWAESPSTSGYCSIVDGTDPGATYSTQNRAQRYTDPNGTFYSIFQADGVTLNPNIFEPNTSNFIYQKNVNKLRNGNDGYFLSFGDTSPGPQLRYNDSLAITSEGGLSAANGALQGRYFNPIIGMSLGCKSAGTCDGTDNIFASTNYFLSTAANNQNVDVINTITFPIGNSQIRNLGVSEAVYRRGSAIYSINMADPAAWRNNRDSVIVGMKKGKTAAQDRLDIESWSTFVARGLAGLQNFSSLQYVIPRGDPLHILHGGSANQAKTGRYSANIVNGERVRSQRGNDYPGVRCGVMIFD